MFVLKNLGQQIRIVREQRNISLNKFAKELEVSPAYLSNLENGKTDSIKLEVLWKLQDRLQVLGLERTEAETEFHYRLNRVTRNLIQLEKLQPAFATYLLETTEKGIDVGYQFFGSDVSVILSQQDNDYSL